MAITQGATYLQHALLILTIQFVYIYGKYNSTLPAEGTAEQPGLKLHYEFGMMQEHTTPTPDCKLVYMEYLQAVENFTHCEIHHVKPFNLCLKCNEQYQTVAALYLELNSNPDLEECKTKYMMSDRVQIIVTVQTNVDKMWRMSHCLRCYLHNGTLRERVSEFITLHSIFTDCVNKTKEVGGTGNKSDVCIQCKSQYTSLNTEFNSIYDSDQGDVCMDIMDTMNYTRINWTSVYNCTCGSYDSTPVVVISCFVACTPIVFYVYLRLTGKVRKAKLFKPKRLTSSTEAFSGSYSTAGNSGGTD